MPSFKHIPIVPSGTKYRNEAGVAAIKDGVKKTAREVAPVAGKPRWLKAQVQAVDSLRRTEQPRGGGELQLQLRPDPLRGGLWPARGERRALQAEPLPGHVDGL